MVEAPDFIELAPSGVVLDVPPLALPADVYSRVSNMRTVGGGMARVGGVRRYLHDIGGGLLHTPKFVMLALVNGVTYTLYAGDTGVGVCDGVTHSDVTPSSGWTAFTAGTAVGATYNGVACFNTPGRAPWYWDGTLAVGAVKPLPGYLSSATAQAFASFNQHLFCGSIAVGAAPGYERLIWSDVAAAGSVPSTWVPSATNQAGEVLLSAGFGPILSMLPLAQQLMVYRVVGVWAVQFVGRPFIYTARRLSGEVGAVSRNAVVEVLRQQCILSSGDIVLTDGSTVRSIGDARVKASLFAQVSEAGLRLAHAYLVPGTTEVVFALALGTDTACNVAYVWDYGRDKWSVRDLPLTTAATVGFIPESITTTTWAGDAGTWDADFLSWDATPQGGFVTRAVAASPANLSLYILDTGDNTEAAVPVVGTVERLSMPIGDGRTVKQLCRVLPRITAAPGTVITVEVGSQIEAGDLVTWEAPQSYTVGSGRPIDTLAKGRYLSIRMTGTGANTWRVSGFGIEFMPQGRN